MKHRKEERTQTHVVQTDSNCTHVFFAFCSYRLTVFMKVTSSAEFGRPMSPDWRIRFLKL